MKLNQQNSIILASLVIAFGLVGGGCLGLDNPGGPETSATPSAEQLSYRLIIAPADSANDTTMTHIRITNTTGENMTVFDETLRLDQEHDLSRYFDATSEYTVRVETNGHVDTYGVGDYSGIKLYVNESGVVWVETQEI